MPTLFPFIIKKDNNKDQTKSLSLKGWVNRKLSLICERQNEGKKLNNPFGGAFMILQASNWEGLIYLAFYVSGLFCAKGISMHLSLTVFQKHVSKVACLPSREK